MVSKLRGVSLSKPHSREICPTDAHVYVNDDELSS